MREARPLSELHSLDRGSITLFVVGPGKGEALAVALPERGWLMVDCCKVGGVLPQETLYRQFRSADDPCVVLLTHPHEDHAEGLAELVEALEPDMVALGAAPNPEEDFARSLDALERGANTTARRLVASTVKSALAGIHQWRARSGMPIGSLTNG